MTHQAKLLRGLRLWRSKSARDWSRKPEPSGARPNNG